MTGQALRERPVDTTPAAVYQFAVYDPLEGSFTYLAQQPEGRPKGPNLTIVARSTERVSDPVEEWNSAPDFSAKQPDLGDVEFFTE